MILAKWGGSLLTHKASAGRPRYRATVAERLAREWARGLATAGRRGVLVHGAGSFGHPLALRYAVGQHRLGARDRDRVLARIQASVHGLQQRVVATLRAARVPAMAVPAHLVAEAGSGGVRLDATPFAALLQAGALPVTGGDAIRDDRLGVRILSGDEILLHLARALGAKRVVWATDVDGVLLDGRLVHEVVPGAGRRVLNRLAPGGDATGGMRGKFRRALAIQRLGVEAWILNGARARRFRDAVAGGKPLGTWLPPRRRGAPGSRNGSI